MNEKFLIIRYVKEFIIGVDDYIINFPRKEFVIKDRIINDSLDILELIYIVNLRDDNKQIKIKILSKINMLDFYLERCYKKNIISEKICKRESLKLDKISKMIYGWIKSDSKNR